MKWDSAIGVIELEFVALTGWWFIFALRKNIVGKKTDHAGGCTIGKKHLIVGNENECG